MVQSAFRGDPPTHNPAVQALVRFRWLVPLIAVPVCILGAALGIQAAVLTRPSRDDLLAARVLHTLLGYHVMRATEAIGKHRSPAICLQGWFHAPRHHRPVRGELVLIGNGERLYDFGYGIRRVGAVGPVLGLDRIRFILAGCPRFIGAQVGSGLVRNVRLDVDPRRADGLATDSIAFGRRTPVDLFVNPRSYKPVELAVARGSVHESSDLAPGASPAVVRLVRREFHLRTRRVRRA
jgi:hypothetical protein